MQTLRSKLAVLALITLALLLASSGVQAQNLFSYATVPCEHESEDAFMNQARQDFDGDFLVYFYRANDPTHAQMDSAFFNDPQISDFIKANYACLAVDMDTEEGRALLAKLEQGYATWPPPPSFLVLNNARYETHRQVYGWHKGEREVDTRYWLLRYFKESGTFRADGVAYRKLTASQSGQQ